MVNARTTTLEFTSFSKEKNCPSADDVGTNWQTKIWSGEKWKDSA